jgi:hypothetical protein
MNKLAVFRQYKDTLFSWDARNPLKSSQKEDLLTLGFLEAPEMRQGITC